MDIHGVYGTGVYGSQNYLQQTYAKDQEDMKSSQATERKAVNEKDTFVSSEAGMKALREKSDYYWNARRNNPELDRALYDQDKAEALKDVAKVQNIVMKVVSGQQLTPEEQEMVNNDPMLQMELERRKMEAEVVKPQ
ncbi:MAG: hypothetical protein PHW47_04985 [Lachnospira sp.]|nr:hypothetical protein [Lachnospira sp.]